MRKKNKEINSQKNSKLITKKNKDLKIIIVGDSGTGKTSLINKYILNKFIESYQATIVSQFSFKILEIDDIVYRIHFWDIAGQDRNPQTTKIFCKDSNGIILCCEVNDKKARQNTIKWKESVEQNINLENIPIIILENKCDLLGESEDDYNKDIDELKKFAEENNINNCFRTSAMKGYQIEESINYLINEIITFNKYNEIDEYNGDESGRETVALSDKPNYSIRVKKGNCC